MKITGQTLARYSNGTASRDEIHAVEMWLKSEETEPMESLFADNESRDKVRLDIETVLDRHISLYGNKGQRTLKSRFLWYASAACLVIVFWMSGFYQNMKLFSKPDIMCYDNLHGKNSKSFTTPSGLVFTLAAHSKALTSTNYSDQTSSIQFSGAMEIFNRSGRDMKLEFSSDSKISGKAKHVITCKEGKAYVALHHTMETEEIIVINRNRISDLPGQFLI